MTTQDGSMSLLCSLLRCLLSYQGTREDELLHLYGLSGSFECQINLDVLVNKCKPLIVSRSLCQNGFIGFVNAIIKKHLLSHSP